MMMPVVLDPAYLQRPAWKIQGVAKPIAYWPLQEETGSVAYDWTDSRHGSYTAVTLASAYAPGRTPCPLFDGSTSFANVYSAAFAAAFNGQAFSCVAWCRVGSAGVWTDGTLRNVFTFQADASNYIIMRKATTNNRMQVLYNAGGTLSSQSLTLNPTAFFHIGLTVSKANDRVIAYINGIGQTPLTGLGSFSGSPAATTTVIGAANTTPGAVWAGNIAHVAVYNQELTAEQMAAIAGVL